MAKSRVKKPVTISEMRARAAQFAKDFEDATDEHRDAQTWWNAFFEVFGARRQGQAVFEATAKRFSTGNAGYIDCLMPGVFIGEAKSRGLIAKAYDQMVDYLAGGSIGEADQPRYMLATDLQTIRLYDRDHDVPTEPVVDITLPELRNHLEAFSFIAGGFKPREEVNLEAASVKAAKRLAELQEALYEALPEDDPYAEQLELERAVFMTRLLFLMYGDDVDGLWSRGQFYRLIDEQTSEDGSDVQGMLLSLFQVLARPAQYRSRDLPLELAAFPYVNGGLFNDPAAVPAFNTYKRRMLLDACRTDWSGLSPAIFGSLFQGLATREQRRQGGEHYTSERNILKVLGPLFLDELEDRFQRSALSHDGLEQLRNHLGSLRIFDPACGCGNFLIVAYQRLADLERRILERQRDLTGETGRTLDAFTTINLAVTPEQFFGIEISWWPAKIAETAMFLTQHRATQALEGIGVPPDILPIHDAATIIHADALETEWSSVVPAGPNTYVVGNPPFLGHATRTTEQSEQLRRAWRRRDISRLDYVTAWHAHALDYFGEVPGRWAFVTTNSISQGDQVDPLFTPIFAAGWRIRFAHQTFAWESEAGGRAAVHCVIVGFDRDTMPTPRLFTHGGTASDTSEQRAAAISPYLVEGEPTAVRVAESPLSQDLAPAYFGAMPRDDGGLVVEAEAFAEFDADPIARKYLRRYVGSRELLRGLDRWCLWMVDLDPQDLRRSPLLAGRVKAVRDSRLASKADSTRQAADTAHLFVQKGVQYSEPFLCVPSVFSENYLRVPAATLPAGTIVSNLAFTIDDRGGLAFAVVVSRAFLLWQHTVGGRLESRARFGQTTTWNTFPLPDLEPGQRQSLVHGGDAVLAERARFEGAPLNALYLAPTMDAGLAAAHRRLDRAMAHVLGYPPDASDDVVVARLLDHYASLRYRTS